MTTRKAVFVHSHQLEKYEYPPECPFNISRAGKVRKIVSSITGENIIVNSYCKRKGETNA